jgi:hypothetical protein
MKNWDPLFAAITLQMLHLSPVCRGERRNLRKVRRIEIYVNKVSFCGVQYIETINCITIILWLFC